MLEIEGTVTANARRTDTALGKIPLNVPFPFDVAQVQCVRWE